MRHPFFDNYFCARFGKFHLFYFMLMVLDYFTNVYFKLKFTRLAGKMAYCVSKSSCINNFCQGVQHSIAVSPQINWVNILSELQFERSKREAVRQWLKTFGSVIKVKFNLDLGLANLWTSRFIRQWVILEDKCFSSVRHVLS